MPWKILVADDEPCITSIVSRKLRNAGFEVRVAVDGQEAFDMAMAERPDFLVTDLQMPLMSGLELVARLTAELDEPVPALLLTAKGYELENENLDALPICMVMTKPFSPRELLDNVREALGAAVKT
jgi:two-component system alkaline phosphatase synthesis response regulator PhoP